MPSFYLFSIFGLTLPMFRWKTAVDVWMCVHCVNSFLTKNSVRDLLQNSSLCRVWTTLTLS